MKESTTCEVGTWIERTEKDGASSFLRVAEIEIPGRGYRVERCQIVSTDSEGAPGEWTVQRNTWIQPTSLEDKRYRKIVHWPMRDVPEPAQQPLALSIEMATEATMRAMVAAGKMAEDWLRAKGLSV